MTHPIRALFRPPALFAAALLWAVVLAGAAWADFVADIDDLPLMPGLSEDRAAGVVFESPGGRIVEAVARGTVTAPDVRAFYDRTLPQLGWKIMESGVYSRAHGPHRDQ